VKLFNVKCDFREEYIGFSGKVTLAIQKNPDTFSVSGFLHIVKLTAYANVPACFEIFDFKLPALFLWIIFFLASLSIIA